ncbi:MAG: hypothetical protein FWH03_01635 [Firmicutes bacterium]|nr:hypothetical protein [Bacillota bacterium]
MIINTESFLKNPDKYKGAVILSADEYAKYEEYETLKMIRQRKADAETGNFCSMEDAFKHMDKKVSELDI